MHETSRNIEITLFVLLSLRTVVGKPPYKPGVVVPIPLYMLTKDHGLNSIHNLLDLLDYDQNRILQCFDHYKRT